jgi:protein-tyrosine-phosphatase/N-acetylglutamate synthase-like GNAT family acetyltransferase
MIRNRPPLATALALLEAESLPVSDLTHTDLEHFFFVGSDGSPTGLVGLEIYGTDALLRSLVVCASERRKGLGAVLVRHAEGYATSKGVRSVYLLTTTAEIFFRRCGYGQIDRMKAPPSIQGTPEFASLCPASSAFMAKELLRQMTPERSCNVLFLCTGNSARSILAEAILNRLGAGRIHAFSAGSQPKGAVHPLALELLHEVGLSTAALRSKSWDEYAAPGAPPIHFVFTVCDNAAAETCPVWPGKPAVAHWGIPDPAAVTGSENERRRAFRAAYRALEGRIERFLALPLGSLEPQALTAALKEIGSTGP